MLCSILFQMTVDVFLTLSWSNVDVVVYKSNRCQTQFWLYRILCLSLPISQINTSEVSNVQFRTYLQNLTTVAIYVGGAKSHTLHAIVSQVLIEYCLMSNLCLFVESYRIYPWNKLHRYGKTTFPGIRYPIHSFEAARYNLWCYEEWFQN